MFARVVVVGAETAHLARWQWKTLPSRQLLIERRQEHGSGRVLANQGCQINQVLGPQIFNARANVAGVTRREPSASRPS